ncbi:hypothetical protein GDO86_016582 [Hymenochirus boettgeri]|uniref:Uncharacterized protein n=1 Tax=Hymenochirus boettgeri TaxID=247094 RepID=A0A8T2K5N9_9PIPI|nr:hypothetical protein GDO86_016582 [Hymenochirus boettgeri]
MYRKVQRFLTGSLQPVSWNPPPFHRDAFCTEISGQTAIEWLNLLHFADWLSSSVAITIQGMERGQSVHKNYLILLVLL